MFIANLWPSNAGCKFMGIAENATTQIVIEALKDEASNLIRLTPNCTNYLAIKNNSTQINKIKWREVFQLRLIV